MLASVSVRVYVYLCVRECGWRFVCLCTYTCICVHPYVCAFSYVCDCVCVPTVRECVCVSECELRV